MTATSSIPNPNPNSNHSTMPPLNEQNSSGFENGKTTFIPREIHHHDHTASSASISRSSSQSSTEEEEEPTFSTHESALLERKLLRKVDLRLCTIAGILCSLNLIDSGIISSASVSPGFFEELGLGVGNRYSIAIMVFTIASVTFQLPATIAVRILGPRRIFTLVTVCFGVVTLCTAFISSWRQMVGLRILLGITQAAVFPGLTFLISTWYTRKEQQLRFAFLQSGEVIVLGLGGILNFGLNKLDGKGSLAGWRWMFLVQGLIAIVIGIATYWWIVEFPENSHRSFHFLTPTEQTLAKTRISTDRDDVIPEPWSWKASLLPFLDPKIYGFATLFFLLNLVSTSLSYFLPIILHSNMGFSSDNSILLAAPPYFYAVIPVIISSIVGDHFQLRGVVIVFNCLCTITGFGMLGFAAQPAVRYAGTFLATGAYISNWAALNAYQASNICGQWKRATFAATVTGFNGLGAIAGSFIVRREESPGYETAVWVSIGSHAAMIGIVGIFSGYFWWANKRQKEGGKVLEGRVGFRYTY